MDGNPQRNIHFEEIWQQNNQILFTYLIFWQQKNNHGWKNIQLLFFYSPLLQKVPTYVSRHFYITQKGMMLLSLKYCVIEYLLFE